MLAVVIPNIPIDEKRDEDRILEILTLPTSHQVCFRVFEKKQQPNKQTEETSVLCRARTFAQISICRLQQPSFPPFPPLITNKANIFGKCRKMPYIRASSLFSPRRLKSFQRASLL